MTGVADIPIAGAAAALWEFSLDFYARPGVSAALIELQDCGGLDVNLILFALWHGLSGRGRLDDKRLMVADQAAREIQTELVTPLRALRRRFRTAPDAEIQRLREAIKGLEFEAEKIAQARLAGCAGPSVIEIDPLERRAAARANLTLSLGADQAQAAAARVIHTALEKFGQ
jgi:uncharacterized protein (TIGR02444 family)